MIYLNGEFIQSTQCKIEPSDRGLLLGDGLFETMRIYNGRVFCLEDHYNRLIVSADLLGIPVPIKLNELDDIIAKLIEANNLSQQNVTFRLTLTRGSAPRGLLPPRHPKPTIMVVGTPLPSLNDAPIKLHISKIRRNEYSPLSNIKSLCYLDNILAKKEAAENDAEEAIMLNTKGNVSSVCTGNIFIVTSDNTIITPKIEDGILPGITRKVVIDVCKKNNISVFEQSITIKDVLLAKEVFITNSIIEIQPVIKIDNQLINKGNLGELTVQIHNAYHLKVNHCCPTLS